MSNVIEATEIRKVYKMGEVEVQALCGVSFDIKRGEVIAIMGPSGCGKSTLLNILGLLDSANSGQYYFDGTEVSRFGENQRTELRKGNIGFVFQDHLLLPYLTVKENILLPLLASKTTETEYRQRVDESVKMMERTGISGIADKYPYQISGGEAQRVTLVRALVNKPSILLADEPTGSLDRKNAENLGDLLISMNSSYGITLILATHSQDLADKMRIQYTLSEGKLFSGNKI